MYRAISRQIKIKKEYYAYLVSVRFEPSVSRGSLMTT